MKNTELKQLVSMNKHVLEISIIGLMNAIWLNYHIQNRLDERGMALYNKWYNEFELNCLN